MAWSLCVHILWTSTWSQVVSLSPGINRDLRGNRSHRYHYRLPWLCQGHETRHGPCQQRRPKQHHGSRWRAGHPHQLVLHSHCLFRTVSLISKRVFLHLSIYLPFPHHILAHHNGTQSPSTGQAHGWSLLAQGKYPWFIIKFLEPFFLEIILSHFKVRNNTETASELAAYVPSKIVSCKAKPENLFWYNKLILTLFPSFI